MIVAAVTTAAQEFMANGWPSWTKHTTPRQKESCGVPKFRLRGEKLLRLRGKVTDCPFCWAEKQV